jgi:hypothetical protein
MNVTINICEVSAELADLAVRREIWGIEELTSFMDTQNKWKEVYQEENDCITYTPEAQEVFEEWYDYYFDIIINLSEDGKDTLLGPFEVSN